MCAESVYRELFSLFFYAQWLSAVHILEEDLRKINDCFGVQERHRYKVYAANKKFNIDTQKGFARNFK